MKKMVSWYVILMKNAPEIFEVVSEPEKPAEPEVKEKVAPKKPAVEKKATTEKKPAKKTSKKSD
jgi:hypothetical protein